MVAGEGLDPLLVLTSSLGQGLLGDGINPVDIAQEMDHVFGARQQRQIALDDDAVETVVYKSQQAAQQLGEGFHRSCWMRLPLTTRSSVRAPMASSGAAS